MRIAAQHFTSTLLAGAGVLTALALANCGGPEKNLGENSPHLSQSTPSSSQPSSSTSVVMVPASASVPASVATPASQVVPSATPSMSGQVASSAPSASSAPMSSASAPSTVEEEPPPPESGDGGTPPVPSMTPAECTDLQPDDRQTCATWAEWGECEAAWLKDPGFCNASCNRCEAGPGPTPSSSMTSGEMPPPMPTGLGDDNPYPPIQGGQQGNSTRYWDCCKQSCGWSANASNPVDSCDYSGNNIGVNDQARNVCFDGGNATTCHGMAPWAHSTALAFGYAAANGAPCGTCWQLQFTGTSQSSGNDSGSAAIKDKTMIVMATNIGDLNGNLHFDLLIPGGGLGLARDGCPKALNMPESELGANRGGFLTDCAGAGDLNAKKECVRAKCESVFGSRGLTDLEAGCLWFVDWFQVAHNPDFLVQQVDCPQELRQFN